MSGLIDLSQVHFIKSAAKPSQSPPDDGLEVAFCGRSNAGKSSAINYLTDKPKLARTSKTPGRTQLINFFGISDGRRLVDLPGYGYAKVPEAMRAAWRENIDDYLRNRESLAGLILVMDIRHPLKEFDEMMLQWCESAGLPLHIILTKCDKLKRGPRKSVELSIASRLPEGMTVQSLSSTHDIGRNILLTRLGEWLASARPSDQACQEGQNDQPVDVP